VNADFELAEPVNQGPEAEARAAREAIEAAAEKGGA
jgi:hypothetical protein